jgi:hypothetical protein
MTLNIVRCKHCNNAFQSDADDCPHCSRRSPLGFRNLLLKWISVFIFFAVIFGIGMAFLKQRGL